MAKQTPQQIVEALRLAGWPVWSWPLMFGIAMAESSGDTSATANTTREYSVGLWQINLRAHPWVTEQCARDPVCAARAAWQISSSGTNFNPWTVYRTGAWLKYLAEYVGSIPAEFYERFPQGQSVEASEYKVPGSGSLLPDLRLPTAAELMDASKTVVLLVLGVGLVLAGVNGLAGENQAVIAAKAAAGRAAGAAVSLGTAAATGGGSLVATAAGTAASKAAK